MVFKLYLVNHTHNQYIELCRSNFSQERVQFTVPYDWNGHEDDMEVMTQFVFREKLKNRKDYELIEIDEEPEMSDSEEDESDEEDGKEEARIEYTKNGDTKNGDAKKGDNKNDNAKVADTKGKNNKNQQIVKLQELKERHQR